MGYEELAAGDEEEADIHKPTAAELQEKIERLKERKGRYSELKHEMETSG
jgi:hypothetical protein